MASEPHDEFLELCALSTTGQLTEAESETLQHHLAECRACRQALHEFEFLTNQTIPAAIASQEIRMKTGLSDVDPGPGWSFQKAEERLFRGLKEEKSSSSTTVDHPDHRESYPLPESHGWSFSSRSTWRQVWMLYAASVVLIVTLGFSAYWAGRHRDIDAVRTKAPAIEHARQTPSSLEEQLSDAAHQRDLVRSELVAREQEIIKLRQNLEQQSAVVREMKDAQQQLEGKLRAGEAERQELTQQRAQLLGKLETAETESQALEHRLDTLTADALERASRGKALEARVNDLTRQLADREAALAQQDQLLSHDRDIRELIGARDLYIAEVYDVGDNGATRKPYGRVFYTKGKSLIFYAYDLDQQATEHRHAFQAWGRRGPDRHDALNLGMFNEDNASKKRWVLKLNDPKALAQIDAVFVTVEPHGGSEKPSGKPLLFAYLRVDPNHP